MPVCTYEKARRVLLLSQGKVTLWVLLVFSVFGLSEAYVTCALGKEMVILPFLEINTIKRQKTKTKKNSPQSGRYMHFKFPFEAFGTAKEFGKCVDKLVAIKFKR